MAEVTLGRGEPESSCKQLSFTESLALCLGGDTFAGAHHVSCTAITDSSWVGHLKGFAARPVEPFLHLKSLFFQGEEVRKTDIVLKAAQLKYKNVSS